jgi:hypothetical protein
VLVHNFSEAFTHHVDLMWLIAKGLTYNMTTSDDFHRYVRGYDPKASFPGRITMKQLVEATNVLQRQRRVAKFARKKSEFKGRACVGIQIDMWWDSETQTAFAAASATTVEEPSTNTPQSRLKLESEILEFDVFPFSSKTGENIKTWLAGVMSFYGITHEMTSGVCPDGAADGQCALSKMDGIAEKVDTCLLHIKQRALLAAMGLAYSKSLNPEFKEQLRANNNVVTLSNQSGHFLKGLEKAQTDAGVPPHKMLALRSTNTTRWGNQSEQTSINNTIRLAIDSSLLTYKKANKANKEAIVVSNESAEGSKVGQAVAAVDIGLSPTQWDANLEVEAYLHYPYNIKQTIEHKSYCTGAQGMMLLHDLADNFCDPGASLTVKEFPKSLSVTDRERVEETRDAEDIKGMIVKARKILHDELHSRLFALRPSNWRLVQVDSPSAPPSCDAM